MAKCPVCGLDFNKDKVKCVMYAARRYAHYACAPDKPIYENEYTENEPLIKILDLTRKSLGDEFNQAKVIKQVNDFRINFNLSYEEIYRTILYWYNIRHNSPENSMGGIGIVPYVYKEANKFFETLRQSYELNKNIKDVEPEVKTIRIKQPRKETKSVKLFKMESEEE